MPIEDRELATGTRLVGSYKKEDHVCMVEADEEGKPVYVLADGRRFKSPSSAAGAVMGGKSVNGWLFWSRAGEELQSEGMAPAATVPKARKPIYKLPNQRGIAAGKSRWYCSACGCSFVADSDTEPSACPEGHGAGGLELTIPPAGAAAAAGEGETQA